MQQNKPDAAGNNPHPGGPPPDKDRLNTADILVDRLIAWGVEVIFGIIGDGINPLIEALRKRQDQIRFITVRHEEGAAFMACGYAKATGRLGACIATSGPGAVHLMNGLYDAAMDGAPVIAITGMPFHDLLGTYYMQEVNAVSLMQDVALYNQMITGPRNARTIVDLACRTALAQPGVAHLSVPKDVQRQKLAEDSASEGSEKLQGSAAFQPRMEVPPAAALAAVADLLNRGRKIMVLAGRGALSARAEVLQLAQKLGAPVAKALLGKALLPDDSPYTTGGIGHLGTLPSKELMAECDTLLILGSNMPYLDFYPKPGQARIVQIDRDPKRIGLRCAVDIGLHGDVAATLQALLPLLAAREDQDFLRSAQQRMADWQASLERSEQAGEGPIKPQYLAAVVGRLLKEDALLAIDTGAHTLFTARHVPVRGTQQILVSGNLATMGPALPYAIGAQLAFPGRQCIAMAGDGGITMLMAELATAVRYSLPVKVVVFKNNSLSMDAFEQEELGYPEFGADLSPIDFVKVAEACGAEGYRIDASAALETTLQAAFASARPALIEVNVDPGEMPVPPEKV